jgi:membrane-associated phospholipid phosphatase
VVYCQMHYAVDALAGLAVGVAVAGSVGRWSEVEGRRS